MVMSGGWDLEALAKAEGPESIPVSLQENVKKNI